jgi:hypothetical protein
MTTTKKTCGGEGKEGVAQTRQAKRREQARRPPDPESVDGQIISFSLSLSLTLSL